jgi:predicted ATP-dependent endonuclease of OLD family
MKENARYSNPGEPSVFLFVKHRISYLFNRYSWEHNNRGGPNPQHKLGEQPFFKKINDTLKSILELSIKIERNEYSMEYNLLFLDTHNQLLDITELSAGEKSIIHFIFCVYGYDLKDGIMIIDEPESHIHPQIQKKFLNIIKEASEELNMQFVIVTHSSIMVDYSTVTNIFRFYKDSNNNTKVAKPILDKANQEESTLIRILTYTNSSKIFFVKKLILVEGPTDEYFFRVFLDTLMKGSNKIEEVEILSIEGKGVFSDWRKFLNKFKITNYYIGDLDNVLDEELGMINSQSKKRLLDDAKKYDATIIDTQSKKILKTVKANMPNEWKMITDLIDRYPSNIFILKEGELEDYLQISNSLEQVIYFCQNRFNSWYNNDPRSKEISNIFSKILQ